MPAQPLGKTCSVCGSHDPNHDERDHRFRVVSDAGAPLALTVDMQRTYDDSASKARQMAVLWADLARCFPDKRFGILPSRLMLTREGENTVLLGEAHVAEYILFELPTY